MCRPNVYSYYPLITDYIGSTHVRNFIENNIHAHSKLIGMPNNANVIRSKYIKKPKEERQNRLISPLCNENRHKF
jgi:hypothetical protein